MKRLFTLLFCAVAGSLLVHAQSPERPRYEIRVFRADTSLGVILVELFPEIAPLTVRNFDSLARMGFYDGTAFHRVIPGFMIQGGDPNSRDQPEDTWGFGDPDQGTVPAEFSAISHKRGILSMARRGDDINSATSQFFICVKDQPQLDGAYTVFGQVVSGMAVADTIVKAPRIASNNRPLVKISMEVVPAPPASSVDRAEGSAPMRPAVFPNPCGDIARVEYALAGPAHVRLAIHDAAGRLVAVPVDREEEGGAHIAGCDLAGHPAGVYTYTLNVAGRVTAGKFVKGE